MGCIPKKLYEFMSHYETPTAGVQIVLTMFLSEISKTTLNYKYFTKTVLDQYSI